MFNIMWCHAQYLSGGAGWSRVVCYLVVSWTLSSKKIVLYTFFLSVFLLFSSPFAVLLNCFYCNTWGFAFSFSSPSKQGRKKWESDCVTPPLWVAQGDKRWRLHQFITHCLFRSFSSAEGLLTLFPCSSMGSYPWETVLHDLLQ